LAGKEIEVLVKKKDEKKSEIFTEPFLKPGKHAAGRFGLIGLFTGGWRGTGNGPFLCRGFTGRDILDHPLWGIIHGLKTPREPDLIGIFVLPDPVRGIHIPTVFCFLDGILVVLREMNLTLEGD
jgi:hypothetical protein